VPLPALQPYPPHWLGEHPAVLEGAPPEGTPRFPLWLRQPSMGVLSHISSGFSKRQD